MSLMERLPLKITDGNRSMPLFRPWILLLIAAVVCSGCGINPETLTALKEAVNAASAQNGLGGASPTTPEVVKVAYEPMYPDRVDPFSFPGQPSGAPIANSSTAAESVTDGIGVQVLGFANVDEPRVLLRIKGNTASLKAGDSTDGVEVIAIRPPAAELRIGTLSWTATMFDK